MSVKSMLWISTRSSAAWRSRQSFARAWRTILCVIGIACLAWTVPAQATVNLVQNGQFLTTSLSSPGGYICAVGFPCTSQVADWGSDCNFGSCGNGGTVADLLFHGTGGVAFNSGNGLWAVSDSPDGGNYVAIDGDPTFTAPLFQTISGLTVGHEYELQFWQSSGQQFGTAGATTQKWGVTLGGGAEQFSTLMNTPSEGSTPWTLQTMDFFATGASEVLNFMSIGTPPRRAAGRPAGGCFAVSDPGAFDLGADGPRVWRIGLRGLPTGQEERLGSRLGLSRKT
jgi:hypothetical protein